MAKNNLRLTKEYESVSKRFDVEFDEDNIRMWFIAVRGPDKTPYENGTFLVKIVFGNDYPMSPPTVTFETKILHPNVKKDGGMCIALLKNEWTHSNTVNNILDNILTLLTIPNLSDPINVDLAKKYLENYEGYKTMVKEYTREYAT